MHIRTAVRDGRPRDGRRCSVSLAIVVALGIAAACAHANVAAAASTTKTCNGRSATIIRRPIDDVIRGTPRADVIVGTAGSDRIYGLGGNDLICGGGGDDFIDGGPGKDVADGGSGTNVCANVERRSSCRVDDRPPRITSISSDGGTVDITFDELLDPAAPPVPAEFQIETGGAALTATRAAIAGRSIKLTLGRPIYSDDEATLAWSGDLRDLSGNLIDFLAPRPITNRSSLVGCTPYLDQSAVLPTIPRSPTYLPSVGTLHALLLFVDFSDAPGDPGQLDYLAHAFGDAPQLWFNQASYGRLQLSVTPLAHWLRMPAPSTSYNVKRLGDYAAYTAYLQQAIALADPLTDFHGYDIVYVVSSPGSAIYTAPAWIGSPPAPLAVADGVAIHEAAGEPSSLTQISRLRSPGLEFAHETGHMLGLLDLYDFNAYGFAPQFDFVGSWDLMSDLDLGQGPFAWERWQLGWLDSTQVRCVDRGSTLQTDLTPIESLGGLKMIVIRDPSNTKVATVIENRQPIANDSALCYAGALVTNIRNDIQTGYGPIRVVPAHPDDTTQDDRCGFMNRSALAPGESLTDPLTGSQITVGGTPAALSVDVH